VVEIAEEFVETVRWGETHSCRPGGSCQIDR
jgi:hypothetical protein